MRAPSFVTFLACMAIGTAALAAPVDPCGNPTQPGAKNCIVPAFYGAKAFTPLADPALTVLQGGHALRFDNAARFGAGSFIFSSRIAERSADGALLTAQQWYAFNSVGAPTDATGFFLKQQDDAILVGNLVAGEQFGPRSSTSMDPAVRLDDYDKRFEMQLMLSYRGDGLGNAGPNGPVLGMRREAYVDDGGPIDPNTWSFFDIVGGTLVGAGLYEGLELTLYQADDPAQSFLGANNLTTDTGLFAGLAYRIGRLDVAGNPWLENLARDQRLSLGWDSLVDADETANLNIDWDIVPEPASLALFGLALTALTAARRRPARARP